MCECLSYLYNNKKKRNILSPKKIGASHFPNPSASKHHSRLIDSIVGFTDSKLNVGDFLKLYINFDEIIDRWMVVIRTKTRWVETEGKNMEHDTVSHSLHTENQSLRK